ncbi:hypothetical protein TWF225_007551 [Orbilia oligospora]|uniref:Uncharacterized protein n=1 Tax=Orbilia oligospora TaxID=2813651 RepID=A0A7C8K266_ORBOL|nr:hypothetical protein TWF751_001094 [Orbilia oligospora]KAF3179338.1 hypothetical protein TWF225_007551 [Orbilia oligospora]KAF3253196.1 hypothetical protein TWF128_006615 [Orbilia oligospora]KAF3277127.1 hypothetical protein TWF132_001771 [Orbilia oligospora]TGJ66903.1 hypothetical protein EYR41_008494 [Orbilia oligospora]
MPSQSSGSFSNSIVKLPFARHVISSWLSEGAFSLIKLQPPRAEDVNASSLRGVGTKYRKEPVKPEQCWNDDGASGGAEIVALRLEVVGRNDVDEKVGMALVRWLACWLGVADQTILA